MERQRSSPRGTSPLINGTIALGQHQQAVLALASTVKQYHDTGTPLRIHHGPSYVARRHPSKAKEKRAELDISQLNHVIHVNTDTRTVLVEPAVSMSVLLAASLPFGLMPALVLEFPNVTCGGAFSGTGCQSSSFRYGGFEDTVSAIEVVLGNGEIVPYITPDSEQSDLFWGCAGGRGSVGIVTMLEVRLVPARPFVQLSYYVYDSIQEAVEKMEKDAAPSKGKSIANRDSRVDTRPDFMDAIVFSPSRAVVMTGQLSGTPAPGSVEVQQFTHKMNPFFYAHVENIVIKSGAGFGPIKFPGSPDSTPGSPDSFEYPAKPHYMETVPLPDYLFRFDRGVFFGGGKRMATYAQPNRPLFRSFSSAFLRPKPAIRAVTRSGLGRVMASFTASVAPSRAPEAAIATADEFGVWPLWLCPSKVLASSRAHPGERYTVGRNLRLDALEGDDGLAITIGCFGLGKQKTGAEMQASTRRAVENISHLGGSVSASTPGFRTENEFWKFNDKDWYEGLRTKYDSEGLPSYVGRSQHGAPARDGEKPIWTLGLATAFWLIWYR